MILDSLPVFILPQSITRQKKMMHHNNGKNAVRYLSFLLSRHIKTTTTTTRRTRKKEEKEKERLYHYVNESIVHRFTMCLDIEGEWRYSVQEEEKKHQLLLIKQ